MAVFPTLESILLEVHQSLGLKGHQTGEKRKLQNLEKRLAKHAERISELIDDIFSRLGLAADEALDLLDDLEEVANFLRAVELRVWTLGASERQVLWVVLGYILAPGLGRKVAIWDQYSRLDVGMPGGQFWFLPQRSKSGTDGLSLPVQNVMAWLIDILGLSLEQLERSVETDKHKPGAVKATLRNWKSGKTLPDPDVIEEYFREGVTLDFRGTFVVDSRVDDPDFSFQRAIEFVNSRGLTADDLRDQLPMTRPGLLESLLSGEADKSEKNRFVECLRIRYTAPNLRTIRQRLLIARAMQDGYLRLADTLCPGVDARKNENPGENKLLQIQAIFEKAYNVTISSYSSASSEEEEYDRFRCALSEIEQMTTFLSVMTHHGQHAVGLVADLVNERFQDARPDGRLEDIVGYDRESVRDVSEREWSRFLAEQKRLDGILSIKKNLSPENYESVIEGVDSWDVVSALAGDPELPPFVQLVAGFRSRDLASSARQKMMSSLFLLAFLLNGDRRLRPNGSERIVESLLEGVGTNPWAVQYRAMIDQLRAKHHLSKNQVDQAKRLFRDALEESKQRSSGSLRGEIARDLLAVEVGLGKLIPDNHEVYWRNMMAFGMFQGGDVSLEAAADWARDYFWEDLYAPYDGYEPLRRVEG